jgi:hypothetical protein
LDIPDAILQALAAFEDDILKNQSMLALIDVYVICVKKEVENE